MDVFKITAKNPSDTRWISEHFRPPVLVQVASEKPLFSQFIGLHTFKPSSTSPNYSMWNQEQLEAELVHGLCLPELPAVIYEEQPGIWIAHHLASDANTWASTAQEAMIKLVHKINPSLERAGKTR